MLFSCSSHENKKSLFEMNTNSGISFNNELKLSNELNPYTYRNFYNGGGVAIGDINNDGFDDVYFSGNQVNNKLYLNKGNLKFQDITLDAGVSCKEAWSTGVTMVDINADGWLDIYVCKAGDPNALNRKNELFINQKNGTFKEGAKKYGLDFRTMSVQSIFFDYDKDGDLDMYLLSNSIKPLGAGFERKLNQRNLPDTNGNKLLRNDNGYFVDVTTEMGIFSSGIGFGLGATVADFNNDGWEDIFIANDFFEKDYLYINKKGERFIEQSDSLIMSMSMGSMGADVADVNNDGWLDLFVSEMLPQGWERKTTKNVFESWEKYQVGVKNGYHHQYSRNAFQRNVNGKFIEIGRFANVDATDWSWGALFLDINNDGLKDLYVCNGIRRDLLDRDYLSFAANENNIRKYISDKENGVKKLVELMPSKAISNRLFMNEGNFVFKDIIDSTYLPSSFSNGSSYADLDNDGDLDLVVNNIDKEAFLLENKNDNNHSFIKIHLKGKDNNTFGIGARVKVFTNDVVQVTENYTSRGFQSSVPPTLHFGLKKNTNIDSIIVKWNNGEKTKILNTPVDTFIEIEQKGVLLSNEIKNEKKNFELLDELKSESKTKFSDFDREPLLFQMYNNLGSKLCKISPSSFLLGTKKGNCVKRITIEDKKIKSENLEIACKQETHNFLYSNFDEDGSKKLLVLNGGRSVSSLSSLLSDEMFSHNKEGFVKNDLFPINFGNSSSALALDINNDGRKDILVAERIHSSNFYGKANLKVFINHQEGFKESTSEYLNENIGKIIAMDTLDVDADGTPEIICIGEWNEIQILKIENGKIKQLENEILPNKLRGLWTSMKIVDVDNDENKDIILGNYGQNHSFSKLGIANYNGTAITCQKINNRWFPLADRDEILSRFPKLKKKYFKYEAFAKADIHELFGNDCKIIELDVLSTGILKKDRNKYIYQELPSEAQYTSIYAIETFDLNDDGYLDIIVGGNQFLTKPKLGRQDAGVTVLLGSKGGFKSENTHLLPVNLEVRDIKILKQRNEKLMLVAGSQGACQLYRINI